MKLAELGDIVKLYVAKALKEQEDIDQEDSEEETDDEETQDEPDNEETPDESTDEPADEETPDEPIDEPAPTSSPVSSIEPEPTEPSEPDVPEPTKPEVPKAKRSPAPKNISGFRNISKSEATQLIKNTRGRFFTASFTKKDGTNRIMNARLGVKAYLRGGELPYNPEEKGLIPVFDVKKKEYRMINLKTLNGLKIGNSKYVII